jgi:hypothetical protein
MRHGQEPMLFSGPPLTHLLRSDPEAFFCPVPLLCEGETEMGLLDELLPVGLHKELDSCGVHLIDGRGQPNVLGIADALIQSGIHCGTLLDNEAEHSGRRAAIEQQTCALVWQGAVNIEDAVCKLMPLDQLFDLLPYSHQASGTAVRYLEDQIFQVIPEADRRNGPRELRSSGYPEDVLRRAFYAAMHDHSWFKSRHGGRVLARALTALGMPEAIGRQIAGFIDRLRSLIR